MSCANVVHFRIDIGGLKFLEPSLYLLIFGQVWTPEEKIILYGLRPYHVYMLTLPTFHLQYPTMVIHYFLILFVMVSYY